MLHTKNSYGNLKTICYYGTKILKVSVYLFEASFKGGCE